jgi:hypothetical protein
MIEGADSKENVDEFLTAAKRLAEIVDRCRDNDTMSRGDYIVAQVSMSRIEQFLKEIQS